MRTWLKPLRGGLWINHFRWLPNTSLRPSSRINNHVILGWRETFQNRSNFYISHQVWTMICTLQGYLDSAMLFPELTVFRLDRVTSSHWYLMLIMFTLQLAQPVWIKLKPADWKLFDSFTLLSTSSCWDEF